MVLNKFALFAGIMSLASICSISAEGADDSAGGGDSEGTSTSAPEPATEEPAIDPEFVESEAEVADEDDESEAEEAVEEDDAA